MSVMVIVPVSSTAGVGCGTGRRPPRSNGIRHQVCIPADRLTCFRTLPRVGQPSNTGGWRPSGDHSLHTRGPKAAATHPAKTKGKPQPDERKILMSTSTSTPRPTSVLRSSSTSLILLGVLAIIVGIIAIAWPKVTIYALVILFAVYAFIDAGLQTMRAFSSRTAGPVLGHLLLALIALAAGVIALAWPGPTALVLVLVVGIWAFIGGIFEIFAAFASGETAGTRALFIITGLVSILFGVVLFAHPNIGAVTLALLFGLFTLIYGFSQIAMGIELRRASKAVDSAMNNVA